MDALANFCKVTVNQGYDANDTTIAISSTDPNLSRLPNPATDGEYNLVWYDATVYPDPSDDPNKEIVRVVSKTGNVLEVERGSEDTSPGSTKNTSGSTYKMALSYTAKFGQDIDANSIDIGAETKYVTELTSLGAAGAVGDGVTDDYNAIADHVTNGSYVYFPPGTWLISAVVTLHSNLYIKGSGIGVTTIKLKDSSGAVSMFTGTSLSNITIEDVTLDGNKANNASAHDGFELITCTAVNFRNVEIKNCKRDNFALGCASSICRDCLSTGADTTGFKITGDNNVIQACRTSGCVTGINVVSGSDDTIITSCNISAGTTKVTDAGTATHARGNVGWKTATQLQTAQISGASTGFQTESIAHGLDVTPAAINCNVSLSWENATNPTNFPVIRGPWIMSVDATNIKIGVQVITAGDSVNYRQMIFVDAKP